MKFHLTKPVKENVNLHSDSLTIFSHDEKINFILYCFLKEADSEKQYQFLWYDFDGTTEYSIVADDDISGVSTADIDLSIFKVIFERMNFKVEQPKQFSYQPCLLSAKMDVAAISYFLTSLTRRGRIDNILEELG